MTTPIEPTSRRPLVLLAEDEAIIAIELEDSLRAAGFEVAGPFVTCTAAEAWLATGQPDAAILDNALRDGPCDALASCLAQRGVPVIIYSGHQQGRETGSSGSVGSWVTKPAPFPVLLQALRRELKPGA